MIKKTAYAILVLMFISIAGCGGPVLEENAIFISTAGNDAWSGRLPAANGDKTDGPLRSLVAARDTIRDMKSKGEMPAGGITVYLRGGFYLVHNTIRLSAEDSGRESAPIIWRAYPNEKVSLSGGVRINGFSALSDVRALQRIDARYHASIVELDIRELGITDYGTLKPKGFSFRPHKPLAMELVFKNRTMTLARYPDEGWVVIASVPQSGAELRHEGSFIESRFGIPVGRHYGKFCYEDERPGEWYQDDDMWMHGYWTWDWADTYDRILKIDAIKKEIHIAEPFHGYGYTKDQRYYYFNILEELDSPGEYYIDRKAGKLYFWPPVKIEKDDAVVTMLEEPVFSLDDVSNVRICSMTFENSRTTAIEIKGGNDNEVAGCVFRNLGNVAVNIEGGTSNGLRSCDLYDLAGGGIELGGGDRKTLVPGGNYADNNEIYQYSRIFRTYSPAIRVAGVGNRVSHNHIHDAPHAGILFTGNEHVLEYNEVHDLAKETGDVGAFYIGRNWTCRGNVVRYNYFHHLHGPGLHGINAVYLDDFASGTTVYGNVFYDVDRGAFIGGGRDNTVENNIFIDCQPSVHLDARGKGWASFFITGKYTTMYDRMDAMNFSQPPYSTKYPRLLTLYDDDPGYPKGNKVIRNVSYRGKWLDIYGGVDFNELIVENNLVAASEPSQWSALDKHVSVEKDFIYYKFGVDAPIEALKNDRNRIKETDPGFRDYANRNFQLNKDSDAFDLGFERIPIEKIGIYKDEYRDNH
ncbi:MAG: right-handed parallel beta-helix repeat-containing protein [candidate division KSB1 bacterium]|jgi:hypothetical protein|nr:right-handed parallel beta-helix repeat-containing protein [candidate division KSB1 bacterium]